MKKLFTLCASALLAFTLSAQSEHAQGSYYLGTGDATQLINVIGNGTIDLDATIGYAVKDDVVLITTVKSTSEDNTDPENVVEGYNTWNLGVRYFGWNGFGVGIHFTNFNEGAEGSSRSYMLELGKYLTVGSISDRLYVYPNFSMDEDQGINSAIEFGFRF